MPAKDEPADEPSDLSDFESDNEQDTLLPTGGVKVETPVDPSVPAPAAPASPDPFEQDITSVRRRSVVAANRGGDHEAIDDGKFPTNEQVVQALQLKVAKSVEVARRYRRVLWYSVFVGVYLAVLYLQARAYKSADVVSTLRNALMVDGQLSMTFNNEDEVLAYLANKILLPTWKDPVCGDGQCEWPWEFPAYGRFGCESDCGRNTDTTRIAVNVRANFAGHPNISPRVLMSSVRWNLCLNDPERTARGEADLCWWEQDQTFSDIQTNRIEAAEVVDGIWYIVIKGDYTGRVTGTVFDLSTPGSPEEVELTPRWEKCRLPDTTPAPSSSRLRKLLEEYKKERTSGDRDPNLLTRLRSEHFPELPPLNLTEEAASMHERMQQLQEKKQQLEEVRAKLAALHAEQRSGAAEAARAAAEGDADAGTDDEGSWL